MGPQQRGLLEWLKSHELVPERQAPAQLAKNRAPCLVCTARQHRYFQERRLPLDHVVALAQHLQSFAQVGAIWKEPRRPLPKLCQRARDTEAGLRGFTEGGAPLYAFE